MPFCVHATGQTWGRLPVARLMEQVVWRVTSTFQRFVPMSLTAVHIGPPAHWRVSLTEWLIRGYCKELERYCDDAGAVLSKCGPFRCHQVTIWYDCIWKHSGGLSVAADGNVCSLGAPRHFYPHATTGSFWEEFFASVKCKISSTDGKNIRWNSTPSTEQKQSQTARWPA